MANVYGERAPAVREATIVVVDDDDGHSELVRRNLGRAGLQHPIVAIGDGQTALDYVFRRGAYAGRPANGKLLLLLGINMPGLDGVEVLRQIKAHPETRQIPVIMLTTTDDPREIHRCYALGCSLYVAKPGDPLAFTTAIHRLGLFISVVSLPRDAARLP